MNKAVRKAVIAGNWKMNKTPAEAKELITAIAPLVKDAGCDVVACVPYVDIATAIEAAKGTNIKIGAENCHWAVSGAFTGEISAEMLKACGVEYVITATAREEPTSAIPMLRFRREQELRLTQASPSSFA